MIISIFSKKLTENLRLCECRWLVCLEKIKKNSNNLTFPNYYFWRTQDKKEIDLLEEIDGKISAYEIKLKKEKVKEPKIFKETYPNSSFTTINKNNFIEFL